ncbi:MAG: UDP-N-acetylglucosamine 2-epimerase (hydrolyzing) [Muribaculaceae bacterium]|nr:UDP-N-acetylglucosamine 2-epimerase (hydrolyzing) [Muribaculaceae bacterium]
MNLLNYKKMKRKICIVTGTRAEWGLLSGIAKALDNRKDVVLQIIATNMHLSEKYGDTWKEIQRNGLKITLKVPIPTYITTAHDTVNAMSECMKGMSKAFSTLSPDLILILGDRFEMLAVASAALIHRIPVAHMHGGEVTQGAFDESIRHSITKMSHLHFTSTEEARNRIIQLGENPAHVFNTGAIGVYNILHTPLMTREELESDLGITIPGNSVFVTFHPTTLDSIPPYIQCENLLNALDRRKDIKILFSYPNNDTGGNDIIQLIDRFVSNNADRSAVFPSLGARRYLSVLRCVSAVVGNSSSGIIEVPSMHIPTLNIGIRQKGRQRAESVIDCGVTFEEISEGLEKVLSEESISSARTCNNPYEQAGTLDKIVEITATYPLENIIQKPFYDIKQ